MQHTMSQIPRSMEEILSCSVRLLPISTMETSNFPVSWIDLGMIMRYLDVHAKFLGRVQRQCSSWQARQQATSMQHILLWTYCSRRRGWLRTSQLYSTRRQVVGFLNLRGHIIVASAWPSTASPILSGITKPGVSCFSSIAYL